MIARAVTALFFMAAALVGGVLPAASQANLYPPTLQPNTVIGRTGINAGPPQAIPFSLLIQDLTSTPNTWNSLQTFNAGIACNIATPLTMCLNFLQNTSGGTVAGVPASFNQLVVVDSVTCTGSCGSVFIDGWSFIHDINGGSAGRLTLQIVTTVPSFSTWSAAQNTFITLFQPTMLFQETSSNAAGGRVFNFNPVLTIAAGSALLAEATLAEQDLNYAASINFASNLKLVVNNTLHANTAEALLVFQAAGAATGIKNAILVGGFAGGASPFDGTTGTPNTNGGCIICLIGNPGFQYGIDLSTANPQTTDKSAGFPFRSGVSSFGVTFSVDWSGNIIASTLNLGSNSGGILGAMGLFGSTLGKITLNPPASFTSYTWNWPSSIGTSGQPLLSGGSGILAFGTLGVGGGGTNCASASITCFNNITGFTAAGTTGTTSTNLVFSAAPTFTGVAQFAAGTCTVSPAPSIAAGIAGTGLCSVSTTGFGIIVNSVLELDWGITTSNIWTAATSLSVPNAGYFISGITTISRNGGSGAVTISSNAASIILTPASVTVLTLTSTLATFASVAPVSVLNTTAASSSSTGAVTVAGGLSAAGNIWAGTNIIGTGAFASGDGGTGFSGFIGSTNVDSSSIGTNTGTIGMNATGRKNDRWIKIYDGTTSYWYPAWTGQSGTTPP